VPALDAQQDRLEAAHTVAVGISVDSSFCHGAWAEQLGGISMPLLADFAPKGAVAKAFDLYLEEPGITDRATVIIDADGLVRYVASVTPAGKRDIEALVAECEAIDADFDGELPGPTPAPPGLPEDATLYVRDACMFSRWALYAHRNLGLDIPIRNVSRDEAAKADLLAVGGKAQAPCLVVGGEAMYESADIIAFLTGKTARALVP
jgi:glutaredoxin